MIKFRNHHRGRPHDILDAKPEWAQALRQRLLIPELLALPEKFAAFADRVEKRFQALEADMTLVKADVAELKGHAVPVAAQRITGVIAQAANVRRSRWLDSTQIVDIADDAESEKVSAADIWPCFPGISGVQPDSKPITIEFAGTSK